MIQAVDHVSVQTNDFDRAFDFYTRILGLKTLKQPIDFKSRRLCYLGACNINLELYSIKPNSISAVQYSENRAGLDHIAFVVEDIEKEIERFRNEGVKIIKEPFCPTTDEKNQPRIAFIEGPDAQQIEILEAVKQGRDGWQ
jgi:catechol 2,3-dioxygenase-like lactoylglutathione lyase family enzyme